MRSCEYRMAGTNKSKEPAEMARSLRKEGRDRNDRGVGKVETGGLSKRAEARAQGVETALEFVETIISN